MMHKTLISVFVAIFLMITLGGCVADDVDDPVSDDIEKFLGSWNVSDQGQRINYTVTIERNPSNSAQIRLLNFADAGGAAVALVVGSTAIIDQQSIGNNYQAEGEGVYQNDSRLNFTFDLNDGIDIEQRIAVFSR